MASTTLLERRLQKKLRSLTEDPPPGVTIDPDLLSQNLTQWIIRLEGAPGTLYADESFQLQFKFDGNYPFESPEVTFTGPNIPVHPHIYSNGHICLNILTDDWTAVQTVETVCVSILSMLSSCQRKERPLDDSYHVRFGDKNPKKTHWYYHDSSV